MQYYQWLRDFSELRLLLTSRWSWGRLVLDGVSTRRTFRTLTNAGCPLLLTLSRHQAGQTQNRAKRNTRLPSLQCNGNFRAHGY